jgi:secondary thiamine-phosphate synthase enzyme
LTDEVDVLRQVSLPLFLRAGVTRRRKDGTTSRWHRESYCKYKPNKDEDVMLRAKPFWGEERDSMAMMKAHTEYLTFQTKERYKMVHITSQVGEIVRKSGIDDGLCFVSPMHITAAVYVNDNEDGLIEDIGTWLEKLAPAWPGYKHHRTGEDNADAHLKALLLHHETTLPVTKGRLDLGRWQRIFYAEFDGQRPKRVIVKLLGVAKE